MLLFTKAYMFLVTHPDTNPAGEGLTLVNFSITKLSDAQSSRLNLWWKEVYQHVSPEANVSHFPFIFFNLSGFSYFASNALKSPTTQKSGLLVSKSKSKTSTAKGDKEITGQRRFQVADSKYLKQLSEGKNF